MTVSTPTPEDVTRSLFQFVLEQLGGLGHLVMAAGAKRPSRSVQSWIEFVHVSHLAEGGRSNEEFARGTVRIRCLHRLGAKAQTTETSLGWKLASDVARTIADADVPIYDHASGDGSTKRATASFGRVSLNTIDPVDDIGVVQGETEYLMTATP